MFLSAYHFSCDPAELAAAHDELCTSWPVSAISRSVPSPGRR